MDGVSLQSAAKSMPPDLSQLRFRHLKLISAIGKTRNLRLAAELLLITQPAATKILKEVEKLLGCPLFQRLPREMRPTDLGNFVLAYAHTSLCGLSQFTSEFSALRAGGHGHVTVGMIPSASTTNVLVATRTMIERRPLLSLRLIEQSSDRLCELLENRQIDIMVGRPIEPRHRAIFNVEALFPEPVAIVCGRRHPMVRQSHVSLQDLSEWPWIVYPTSTAIRELFEEVLAGAKAHPLAGRIETSSILSMLNLLQVTRAISLQPLAVVRDHVERKLLKILPVTIKRAMPAYGIITRKGETLSEIATELIEVLRSTASRTESGKSLQ